MRTTSVILMVLVVLLSSACNQKKEPLEIISKGQYKRITDISYKKGETEYEISKYKLDLYLPEVKKHFPVLVWFYGGGLFQGEKSENHATDVGRYLATRGIGVVIANYRLNPKVNYPAYIEDAASAVAWTINNIKLYKGNNDQIFFGGHSAGAYLSAMAALDKQYLNTYDLTPDNIAGTILLSGQMNSHFTVKKERNIPESKILVDETAPKFHASHIGPPCLALVAEDDLETTKMQNRELITLLEKAGQKTCRYYEIPGQNHMSTVLTINDPNNQTGEQIIKFIQDIISND